VSVLLRLNVGDFSSLTAACTSVEEASTEGQFDSGQVFEFGAACGCGYTLIAMTEVEDCAYDADCAKHEIFNARTKTAETLSE
jgi:hypothetical protein